MTRRVIIAMLALCAYARASGPMALLSMMDAASTGFQYSDVPGLVANWDSSILDVTTNLSIWSDSYNNIPATNYTAATAPEVIALPSGRHAVNFRSTVDGFLDVNNYVLNPTNIEVFFCLARTSGAVSASFRASSSTYAPGWNSGNNILANGVLFSTYTNAGPCVVSFRMTNLTNSYVSVNDGAEERKTTTAQTLFFISRLGHVGSATYHDGHYYQLLIYTNAITPENRTLIRNKLYSDWGITP